MRAGTPEDVGVLLAYRKVVIIPGYGLAVAQAQHTVRELEEALKAAVSRPSSPSTRWPAACPGT